MTGAEIMTSIAEMTAKMNEAMPWRKMTAECSLLLNEICDNDISVVQTSDGRWSQPQRFLVVMSPKIRQIFAEASGKELPISDKEVAQICVYHAMKEQGR